VLCALSCAPLQSLIETIDQAPLVEGLAQKAHCPGLEGTRPDPLLRKCGDKYDWRSMTAGQKKALQLYPI
jgi:hypothetical protein